MKKIIINIMAATGITLVVLSIIALCYDATVICINTVFQSLFLNFLIYAGVYILNRFEFRYPIIETALKLLYALILALAFGWFFGWYTYLSAPVLILMSAIIFAVCACLDTFSLIGEVREINVLLEGKNLSYLNLQ